MKIYRNFVIFRKTKEINAFLFVQQYKKKFYLNKRNTNLKLTNIHSLFTITTHSQLKHYIKRICCIRILPDIKVRLTYQGLFSDSVKFTSETGDHADDPQYDISTAAVQDFTQQSSTTPRTCRLVEKIVKRWNCCDLGDPKIQ